MAVELSIATRSCEESHRYQVGDVRCAKQYPASWGSVARRTTLIVIVDGMTLAEAQVLAAGWYEPTGDTVDGIPAMEAKAKHRGNIPLELLRAGWIPGLDISRAADPEDEYQPFRAAGIVIDAVEKVALCLDKAKGTYKYKAQKVAP